MNNYKRASNWWYLLPLLFGILGGVVTYASLRNEDEDKAKDCLIGGFVVTAILFVLALTI